MKAGCDLANLAVRLQLSKYAETGLSHLFPVMLHESLYDSLTLLLDDPTSNNPDVEFDVSYPFVTYCLNDGKFLIVYGLSLFNGVYTVQLRWIEPCTA